MLDRVKLVRALHTISTSMFKDMTHSYEQAREIWHLMSKDEAFCNQVRHVPYQGMPWWSGLCDEAFFIAKNTDSYQIVGVDGSQIYPDKHQGIDCFLLNIGVVVFRYGISGKSVEFDSTPSVFFNQQLFDTEKISIIDSINAHREQLELVAGAQWIGQLQKDNKNISLLLFDGALLFWHLSSKHEDFKNHFLSEYCNVLMQLKEQKTLVASYLSAPKNKELIQLITYYVEKKNLKVDYSVDVLTDAVLVNFLLKPNHRTVIFKSRTPLCFEYPKEVAPHFVYCNTGSEIARIEFPAYLAHDYYVDALCSLIIDQSSKGMGYPVVLAEAHEQAVVKAADRDFFYQAIDHIAFQKGKTVMQSLKLQKKRGLAV